MFLTDCNSEVVARVVADNNMPFCLGEPEAFTYFVSDFREDLPSGILSKNDYVAFWEAFAGSNRRPSGKSLSNSC